MCVLLCMYITACMCILCCANVCSSNDVLIVLIKERMFFWLLCVCVSLALSLCVCMCVCHWLSLCVCVCLPTLVSMYVCVCVYVCAPLSSSLLACGAGCLIRPYCVSVNFLTASPTKTKPLVLQYNAC